MKKITSMLVIILSLAFFVPQANAAPTITINTLKSYLVNDFATLKSLGIPTVYSARTYKTTSAYGLKIDRTEISLNASFNSETNYLVIEDATQDGKLTGSAINMMKLYRSYKSSSTTRTSCGKITYSGNGKWVVQYGNVLGLWNNTGCDKAVSTKSGVSSTQALTSSYSTIAYNASSVILRFSVNINSLAFH